MSAVQKIKSAIEQLTLEERATLIADLRGWTDDPWDRPMKADATTGKFAVLNDDADNADQAGALKPLEDVLEEPQESRAAALLSSGGFITPCLLRSAPRGRTIGFGKRTIFTRRRSLSSSENPTGPLASESMIAPSEDLLVKTLIGSDRSPPRRRRAQHRGKAGGGLPPKRMLSSSF